MWPRARTRGGGGDIMSDILNLNATNIKVGTRVVVDPQTRVASKIYTVTYMIGAHGPFEDTYTQSAYTHDAVIAGINKQIQTLRSITAAQIGQS
jgi:hypothetical protein